MGIIVLRTGRRRGVNHTVERPEIWQPLTNIVLDKPKPGLLPQVGYVTRMPRQKVIDPHNLMAVRQNPVAKVRRNEAGRAGDTKSQEYSYFGSVA